MYISHYRLAEKPFQINTDPRFLWLSEIHKEALAVLKYGVMSQNGILVLTGDVGTGKTTLINALLDSLDSDVFVAKIVHSKIDLMGFLSLVGQSFYISERFDKLTQEDKERTLIHELMHIPQGFKGGFRPHKGYVSKKQVERLFKKYKKKVNKKS